MSTTARVPVTVVTGFLGAGKTTLIFRLVTARHRERIGVIVGDVIDTTIDGELLSAVVEAIDSVGASTAGCANVVQALDRMHLAMPALDRIVVETSGLDDPRPLLRAIGCDLSFARVDTVVALADASEPVSEHHQPARRQLQLATQIVISKADLVSGGALSRFRARVRALNPSAEILTAGGHILECELLLDRLASTALKRDVQRCATATIRRRATRALADHAQHPTPRRRSSKF